MKPHTKAAAVTALKWALGLSAGYILCPIIISLASGTALTGNIIAQKLIVGIAWFPILLFGIWVWGTLSKKNLVTGAKIGTKSKTTEIQTAVQDATRHENPIKPNKWNYVCIGAGVFMLLLFFLPEIIKGTLANIYYLGAAFWVGVIIYCSLNILRARK